MLSGIPPPDAESCDITAEAKVNDVLLPPSMRFHISTQFTIDGQEHRLALTFTLHIAPMSTIDSSFASSRRPSLTDVRRVVSDTILPQTATVRQVHHNGPDNPPR